MSNDSFFLLQCKKLVEYLFGIVICITLLITTSSSFVFHYYSTVALNVFLIVCIVFACISNVGLMLWKLKHHPDDRRLTFIIYFNFVNIFLFCVCANFYYHGYWVVNKKYPSKSKLRLCNIWNNINIVVLWTFIKSFLFALLLIDLVNLTYWKMNRYSHMPRLHNNNKVYWSLIKQ